ncbi:HAMP domain-containing sensor histidine kinase [Actinoplanes sp. NPDC051851]|uniref:sensor histidine kinase n=1 Tax=Actinoplanes sp. NPDC051851 TaxID=3154753 RepID=UPI00342CB76B
MRLRSPLRRMVLITMMAFALGYLMPDLTGRALAVWMEVGGACPATPADGPDPAAAASWWCDSQPTVSTLIRIAAWSVVAVVAGLLVPAGRWAMRPLRDVAAIVSGIGPNNLRQRITAPRFDPEIAVLAREVNGMLDRVAVGYESQQRFAAAASHELRTPLAVQRTLIEAGLLGEPSPERFELLAEQLLVSNERNVRLIEALLVLSESDRGPAASSPVRLDHVVEKVLIEHRAKAAEAGVTITSELRDRVVDGEQVLLERLVTNLVQNAIKYNRPGGTIGVTVGARPALRVVNTGDDVPAAATDGLFEPFHRLGTEHMSRADGIGLGLTIVRSIVRAHDGDVTCHSTGRDGLRFDVMLPEHRHTH